MVSRWPRSWEEYYSIVLCLLALRRAGELSGLWIDEMEIKVTLPVDVSYRRRVSWQQAARLAAGEHVDRVIRPTRRVMRMQKNKHGVYLG